MERQTVDKYKEYEIDEIEIDGDIYYEVWKDNEKVSINPIDAPNTDAICELLRYNPASIIRMPNNPMQGQIGKHWN